MEDTNNFEYVNVKARVPKVIDIVIPGAQGLPGEQGTQGPKGDPFRYEDFTPEQLEALKGPKGDKGEDGTSATADNAHQLLLQGNVWCASASVDDVLTALIGNMGKPFPRTEFKPLTIPSVIQGQQVVAVTGEPHYSVKVVGNDTPFTLDSTGACTVTIPPLGEDDINLTYHDFTGAKVGETVIAGIVESTRTPDETYEENGAKYALYGNRLIVNVSNYNGNSYNPFVFMGKWTYDKVNDITINTNKAKGLHIGNNSLLNLDNKPVYVTNPEFITLLPNTYVVGQAVNIGTLQQGTTMTHFEADEYSWSSSEHRYVATGDEWGHL